MGWLLALALLGTAVSTTLGAVESRENREAQKEANQTNLELNEQNNDRLLQLAQQDRDFQLQMSNTAHQREVSDLKAAGLNPVLSASTTGAPVVSSNTANSSAGQVQPVLHDYSWISNSIQSITNLMLMEKLIGGSGFTRAMMGLGYAGKSYIGFSRRM